MSDQGGCDHIGGPEVIEMAEEYLGRAAIPEPEWNGWRFGYGQDIDSPYWKSIYVEVERRENAWVITRLDRMGDPLDEHLRGFQPVGK